MNPECEDLVARWPIAHFLNLPPQSTVVIVGAYKGITMQLMDEMFHPQFVVGFEPQPWACHEAAKRIEGRPNLTLIQTGLLAEEQLGIVSRPMGEFGTDACSIVNVGPGSREQGVGNFAEANYALFLLGTSFDLMIMNIEGYEFELLPYLDKHGWLDRIERLAIQFHLGFGNDDNYQELLERLDFTHRRTVDTLPTWGYWEKRHQNA